MKNYILFSIISVVSSIEFTNAQSLSQQVISSTGNFSSNGGFSISSTTGESAVKTVDEGTFFFTQGFQQTYDLITSLIDEQNYLGEISVFPNPTLGNLYVNVKEKNFPEKLNFYLTDITGRRIETKIGKNWNGNLWELNLTELANGSYYLNIDSKHLKTIFISKIIKVE